MKNLKNLVAVWLTLAGVATSPAQQVVKRITDNATSTIVELFVLRNGTALPNTTGNFNFNTGTSDNKGNVIAYNPALADTYDKQQLPSWFTSHSAEQIGNGTFPFTSNQASTLNNVNFIANGGSWATLNMTIPQEDGNADSTQDANTLSDMMYSKFVLPKTLNDGSAIPNGLIVICVSRSGTDNNSWANSNPTRRLWFQRNQTTLSWAPIPLDPIWNPFDTLQEIGTDGQLWNEDFVTTPSADLKMYPNPAHESITLDDGDNSDQQFAFEIYDIVGKKVGWGQGQEGQAINIENLTNGNYFVKSTTDDKKTTTKKLIKN